MITEIVDAQSFAHEIAQRLSSGQRTNFFLGEDVYIGYIKERKLKRQDFSGGVYFFLEEVDKVELFYFLEKTAKPVTLPTFELPLIMEEVLLSTKERIPSEQDWMMAGFVPYLERKRLYFLGKDVAQEERTVTLAKIGMGKEIKDLMERSFDPFTSQLPSLGALEEDIAKGVVLTKTKGDTLLGFLRFGQVKQGQMLWQIAVVAEARGQGVAKELVLDWMEKERNHTKKFMLWVRLDNPWALKLYETLGFVPDLRIAPVMIKKKG